MPPPNWVGCGCVMYCVLRLTIVVFVVKVGIELHREVKVYKLRWRLDGCRGEKRLMLFKGSENK